MNGLTNTGLSLISKTHEDVMSKLFRLTIHPPRKIEVQYEHGEGVEEMVVVKRDGITKIEWIPF